MLPIPRTKTVTTSHIDSKLSYIAIHTHADTSPLAVDIARLAAKLTTGLPAHLIIDRLATKCLAWAIECKDMATVRQRLQNYAEGVQDAEYYR